jgi:hypothetical protein
MTRTHGFLIALALAVAVVAGMVAALRTTQLGSASSPQVSNAQVVHQTRVLNRAEAALRAQLKRKPPALPAASPAAAPQTVIYRRPAPIVHVIHRHGGDGSSERDDRGGGLDD